MLRKSEEGDITMGKIIRKGEGIRVLLEGKAQQRMSSVVHAWKLPDLLRFTALPAAPAQAPATLLFFP
jgi:ABC-type enterobactin transport system permease subunit